MFLIFYPTFFSIVPSTTSASALICGGVSVSDGDGGLVTVLATDGLTCVTSPGSRTGTPGGGQPRSKKGQQQQQQQQQPEPKVGGSHIIGVSGDSGMSSEDSSEADLKASQTSSSAEGSPGSSRGSKGEQGQRSPNAEDRRNSQEDDIVSRPVFLFKNGTKVTSFRLFEGGYLRRA